MVTSKVQDVLWDASGCADIQIYVRTKTVWVPEMMDWVWWQAIGSAFDSLSLRNKIRTLNFQHNWLPTMTHLHSLYPLESPLCPICAEANEDWCHLFYCKHDTAGSVQIHLIAKLCRGLMKMETNYLICQVIVYKVKQCLGITATPPRIPRDKLGDHLTDAVSTHQELGWDSFMKGRVSKDWGIAQAVHF
eukprot:1901296-Ditylum_brightwellii.AAC.1